MTPSTAVLCRPRPDCHAYELLRDLEAGGIIVPKGYLWDGASIPRIAWTTLGVTPFDPEVMRGSCVHDRMYDLQEGSRRDADQIFRDILLEDRLSAPQAEAMYRAVRLHGHLYWMDSEDYLSQSQTTLPWDESEAGV